MQVSGVFNLAASATWAQSQTRVIRVEVLTTVGAATINLPAIADVQALNADEVEIIISDFESSAALNNITTVADAGASDTIEGAANNVIAANDGVITLKIATDNNWTVS